MSTPVLTVAAALLSLPSCQPSSPLSKSGFSICRDDGAVSVGCGVGSSLGEGSVVGSVVAVGSAVGVTVGVGSTEGVGAGVSVPSLNTTSSTTTVPLWRFHACR